VTAISEFPFREASVPANGSPYAARNVLAQLLGWEPFTPAWEAFPEDIDGLDLPALAACLGLEWRDSWPQPLRHQPAVAFYTVDDLPGSRPHFFHDLVVSAYGLDNLPLLGVMLLPAAHPRLLRSLLEVAIWSLGVRLYRFDAVPFHGEYIPKDATLKLRTSFADISEELCVLAHEAAHIIDLPPNPNHPEATPAEILVSEHIAHAAAAEACGVWGLDYVAWAERVHPDGFISDDTLSSTARSSAKSVADRLLSTIDGL